MDHSGDQLAMPIDVTEVGDLKTFVIRLPFLPPSKNVIGGWPPAWKSAAKQKWVRHIVNQARSLEIPCHQPRIGLFAELVFATAHRRDPQNYAEALWHWVPDALQHKDWPVLLDDRDGAIEFGPNLSITMSVDRRPVAKRLRERTLIGVTVRDSEQFHVDRLTRELADRTA